MDNSKLTSKSYALKPKEEISEEKIQTQENPTKEHTSLYTTMLSEVTQ